MEKPLFFVKHSEMLSVGFDIEDNNPGLAVENCENKAKLAEELKRIGIEEPAPEIDRNLVINYNKRAHIAPTIQLLLEKILSDWGYKFRVL